MCFGGGSGAAPEQQIYYVPYIPENYYPPASQVYQDRFYNNPAGYNYTGQQFASGGGAGNLLGTRPTSTGSIASIGSDAHMSNIPGATQLLGQQNQAQQRGWF